VRGFIYNCDVINVEARGGVLITGNTSLRRMGVERACLGNFPKKVEILV